MNAALKIGRSAQNYHSKAKVMGARVDRAAGFANDVNDFSKDSEAAVDLAAEAGKDAAKCAAKKVLFPYEAGSRIIGRGIQFIFALVATASYAHRVDVDHRDGNTQDVAWLFAVFTGGLTCVSCLVLAIPPVPFTPLERYHTHRLFAWDLFLAVLWMAVFGTFATIFLRQPDDKEEYEGTDVDAMQVIVWIDLINGILWLATGGWGAFRTFATKTIERWEDRATAKVTGVINRRIDRIKSKIPFLGREKKNPDDTDDTIKLKSTFQAVQDFRKFGDRGSEHGDTNSQKSSFSFNEKVTEVRNKVPKKSSTKPPKRSHGGFPGSGFSFEVADLSAGNGRFPVRPKSAYVTSR